MLALVRVYQDIFVCSLPRTRVGIVQVTFSSFLLPKRSRSLSFISLHCFIEFFFCFDFHPEQQQQKIKEIIDLDPYGYIDMGICVVSLS